MIVNDRATTEQPDAAARPADAVAESVTATALTQRLPHDLIHVLSGD